MTKKILVTGACGFIGSHLVEMLVGKGYDVKALVQYNSSNTWGWLDNSKCKDDIEIITGDIRDSHFCKYIVNDVDVVFHLAALIAIPYSYLAPDSYIETNVKGTLNICQAAKENGNIRVISTSTSEVYGTAKFVPINESHPLQGQSPYSASKIAADQLAYSFYTSFKLPVVTVRPFNTYGPRQSSRAVIPTIITQIANNIREIKLGSITPTRDFSYILDTVNGFIAALESTEGIGETINFGSNFEISIGDTAQLIAESMNVDINIIADEQRMRPKNSEVERLWADNSKAKEVFKWQPEYHGKDGFKRGLIETINWFTKTGNLDTYKANIYNV